MKKQFSRLFPLLMAFVMFFSFAACGGGSNTTTKPENTTKTADVDVSVVETTDKEATTEVISTTEKTDVSTTISDSKVSTTQAPPVTDSNKTGAPVNGTIAQIVKYYNDHANATKAYKGTVKIVKSEGSTSKFTKLPGGISLFKNQLNKMLANATGEPKHFNKTFTNGVSSDGDKLIKFLPPSGQTYMSALQPAGVKSATCKAVSGGYKVDIKLIQEVVGYNGKPKWHDCTMDTLTVKDKDVEPFEIVKDNSCKFDYKGATISAVFDTQGRLKSLNIFEPVHITATLKKGISLNVEIDGSWKQDIALTY